MRAVRSGTSWTISNIVGQLEYSTDSWSRHGHSRHSNFCKDHRDKIEVPDPLVVEDLISDKLNNRRKLARLIKQYRDIFPIYPYLLVSLLLYFFSSLHRGDQSTVFCIVSIVSVVCSFVKPQGWSLFRWGEVNIFYHSSLSRHARRSTYCAKKLRE